MKKRIVLLVLVSLLMSGCLFPSDNGGSANTALYAEEILTMNDNDLYSVLVTNFMGIDPSTLNQKQQTVAALVTFDAEMMNGGLCQFFVNDHVGCAQYVGEALGEVGARSLQTHYTSFIDQNAIDLTKMDSFRILSIQGYQKQYERFPYEAFDTAFSEIYQTENLGDLLLSYVRLHSDEISG